MATYFVEPGTIDSHVEMTTWISSTTNGSACNKTESDISHGFGFLAAGVAILLFGTNFAPVKKFDTGDGVFFQWIMCIAIWSGGLVVQQIRKNPQFYPLAMLGGFFWETGNMCVVPIIKTIGLGLGMCIWGMTNLLSGWATGRFGLFGTTADPPTNPVLNDIGVILAVLSAVLFSMVKNTISTEGLDQTVTLSDVNETSPLIQRIPPGTLNGSVHMPKQSEDHDVIVFPKAKRNKDGSIADSGEVQSGSYIDRMSPGAKRIFGISLSLVSGVFYGQMFTPSIYIMDNYMVNNGTEKVSQEALDYVFSTFTGILATSTVYFLIYAAIQKNQPKVYPRAILPGFVSGLMWSIACSGWFVANKVLSEAVAFPIISTGPGVIASILGVFVFKEITGRRNILMLLLAMSVTITGSILCGLSKKAPSC
ncbi:transmembrane protein 144-like isoform X2 [Dreissena polymorpha]|uniref:transmembrane protein 144-like isoform X2 n=1 Tax=Dreissena polymorpha TaxID=45954 RepID=UPI00226478AF|nr:transmembrane protein 144-like isoform X2 [Dreissena polymorpha]